MDLSDEEVGALAEQVSERAYGAGTLVFSEGEECVDLLIVKDGSVKLLKLAANGRQQLLGIERAGGTLSEVAAFDGGRYPATAEVMTDATLLRLDAAQFREFCLGHPEVAMKVIKVLAHRLRSLSRLVEELSFSTVRGRLISHLIRLAEEEGRESPDGIEIELEENQDEIAARLGTVRELVSRNLGRLHGEGLIEMQRRAVLIRDLDVLRQSL